MIAKPNHRRFVLTRRLSQAELDQIIDWIDGYYFNTATIEIANVEYYIVDFNRWTRVKPKYQTMIELMLSH